MNNPAPKRLAKKEKGPSKAPIILLIVLLALAALVIGSYFGLCSWVRDNGLLMPNTHVAGLPGGETVDVSKLSQDAAVDLISSRLNSDLAQRSVTVSYGGQTALLEGDLLYADPSLPVAAAMAEKAKIPLYELGFQWLGYYRSAEEHTVSALAVTQEGHERISALTSSIAGALHIDPRDYTWELTEAGIVLTPGSDGQEVDAEALEYALTEALLAGDTSYTVVPRAVPSASLDVETLRRQVTVEPQLSQLLPDGTMTPTVLGHSIDPAEAQAILDAPLPEDGVYTFPLITLKPDLSQVPEGFFFQEVLCSSETYMAGPEGRRTNIRLAAEAINGTVLLPGELFSYNEIVGQRTAEKGYQKATVYVQGEDRQELGGGICQLASALYYCCVYSDLEIVERKPHRFAVTYVPYGLDATIAWGSIDYKFRNNTDYPLRIECYIEGVNLIVNLYGTKANDNYVKMERIQLLKVPYETEYVVDPALAAGQTEERVHAYTGYEYDTYRCVYDGQGNRLSRTYEDFSRYRVRNAVIAVSPADAHKYGLDPITGEPVSTASPQPSPSPSPSPEPSPEPSPDPVPTETAPPAESVPPSEPQPSEPPVDTGYHGV